MIKAKYKSLFVIICTLFILLMTPLLPIEIAHATETLGGYSYDISGSNATITGYTGSGGDIIIPKTLGVYTVTAIEDYAFSSQTGLTSITIPAGVTSIGSNAFSSCTSLTNVIIPNTVEQIGGYAFSNCTSLKSINIPTVVTNIASGTFSRCTSLTTLTIPSNITSIDDSAFYDCISLSEITIPNTVKTIGDGAFSSCKSLIHLVIPNSITIINSYAFSDCTSLIDITIPSSVTSISYAAFSNCTSLPSVSIPSSVSNIDDSVFYNCINLTDAKFYGDAPATDGTNLFFGCASNFKIYYLFGKAGFANTWYGYTPEPFYNITYQGNNNTSGVVPVDSNCYLKGSESTTVLANTGALAKLGFNFSEWNTEADGSGTKYTAGTAIAIGTSNITLYASYIDLCDIDNDGTVDINDLASLARNYNTRSSGANWNSVFDFNKDGIIDIFDLVICSRRIK